MAPFDHVVEVEVGDEDDGTFEDEGPRKLLTFVGLHPSLSEPRHFANVGGVTDALEKVQRDVVEEDRVSVVEHDHLTGFTEVVEKFVETRRANETFDDRVIDLLRVPSRELFVDVEGLTETGGTGDDHRASVTEESGFGENVEDLKTFAKASVDLSVSLEVELRDSIRSEHGFTNFFRHSDTVSRNTARHVDLFLCLTR